MRLLVKTVCSLLGFLGLTYGARAEGVNELMLTHAVGFLDVPYVAHTLDQDTEREELIVNCDEVDCTTFVEYVLAMSLCPQEHGQISEGDFIDNVRRIRYRDGVVNGYASRLHYITDWIDNGIQSGFLEDVTARESSDVQPVLVNYMTTHSQQYKQLINSPENIALMKAVEAKLSKESFHYLPKRELPAKGLSWIKGGDIIAITTSVPGLDIAHMGIAFYVKGTLCLLHASEVDKKVVVSNISLAQMLKNVKSWTGIRVLRALK